jgi:predicted transcriptional regulator
VSDASSEHPAVLHDLELLVMEQVWSLGEAPVRTVLDALNTDGDRQRAYTTVMTIMGRLHGKGLLERRREGRMDVYSPAMTREDYLHGRAQAEVGALVDEYGDVALVYFAKQMNKLDDAERRRLRRLARRD